MNSNDAEQQWRRELNARFSSHTDDVAGPGYQPDSLAVGRCNLGRFGPGASSLVSVEPAGPCKPGGCPGLVTKAAICELAPMLCRMQVAL